jgi:hypothetical protein
MKKTIIFLSAAILFTTITSAQTKGTLSLAKGQKYVVENKLTTTSSTEVQGQTMDSKADFATTYNIKVKDISGNNFNLSNTLTNIKINMSMMGRDINFDSDKKEDMDGEMGTSLKSYINNPTDVVLDNSGTVIPKPSSDSSTESSLAKQLNLASTGYGAELAFLALPKDLKVGAAWADSSNANSIIKSTKYTVTSITGDIASLSFSGTIASDKKIEQQGMEVNTKTSGKFSGEATVDTKTGVVQTNNSTSEVSGTVSAMGQDFPTSTKVNSVTTVKAL